MGSSFDTPKIRPLLRFTFFRQHKKGRIYRKIKVVNDVCVYLGISLPSAMSIMEKNSKFSAKSDCPVHSLDPGFALILNGT